MKNYIVFLIIISAFNSAVAQDKMIVVNDVRKAGITHDKADTSTAGHQAGDLEITRTLTMAPGYIDPASDTLDTYCFNFYKMFENKLMNFHLFLSGIGNFGNASYKWENDTIVSVTLIDYATHQHKNIKLAQMGNSAGIMKESFK